MLVFICMFEDRYLINGFLKSWVKVFFVFNAKPPLIGLIGAVRTDKIDLISQFFLNKVYVKKQAMFSDT